MTMREALRLAAVKIGVGVLFVVLLLAGLWIMLFLIKLTGWWEWFESAPDSEFGAVMFPALAVLLIACAFIHDRILRKAGLKPREAATVTVRNAMREMAAQIMQALLVLGIMAAWFVVWGVLFFASGLRASMYRADPVWVWSWAGVSMLAILIATFATYHWVQRRWRRKPPQAQERG